MEWVIFLGMMLLVLIVCLAIMQTRSLKDLQRESKAIWRALKEQSNDNKS